MATIYRDALRSIERDGSSLLFRSARGENRVPLSAAIRQPNAEEIAALEKAGCDPNGRYVLCVPIKNGSGGGGLAICPPETRAAVEAALLDYAAQIEAIRHDPANRERSRIEGIYRRAAAAYENADWAQYHALTGDADEALAKWRSDFPEAARRERSEKLLAAAAHQEELAAGALTYDADGSLSRAKMEERAARFRALAAHLRRQAAEV